MPSWSHSINSKPTKASPYRFADAREREKLSRLGWANLKTIYIHLLTPWYSFILLLSLIRIQCFQPSAWRYTSDMLWQLWSCLSVNSLSHCSALSDMFMFILKTLFIHRLVFLLLSCCSFFLCSTYFSSYHCRKIAWVAKKTFFIFSPSWRRADEQVRIRGEPVHMSHVHESEDVRHIIFYELIHHSENTDSLTMCHILSRKKSYCFRVYHPQVVSSVISNNVLIVDFSS